MRRKSFCFGFSFSLSFTDPEDRKVGEVQHSGSIINTVCYISVTKRGETKHLAGGTRHSIQCSPLINDSIILTNVKATLV